MNTYPLRRAKSRREIQNPKTRHICPTFRFDKRLVAFAVALRVESTVRPGPRIMPMAVPKTVGGSIRIVKRFFFLVFLQFLHLPIVTPERFVRVMRATDDWAEFDIVLLCNPSPAMTAGLQF